MSTFHRSVDSETWASLRFHASGAHPTYPPQELRSSWKSSPVQGQESRAHTRCTLLFNNAPFSGLYHTRGLTTMFFSPKRPSKAWPCLGTLRELRGSKRRKGGGRETEEKGKKGSVYHLGEVRRRELVGKKEIGAPGGEGGGSLTTTLSLLCLPSGRRTPKVLQDTLQQPCTGFKLKICY